MVPQVYTGDHWSCSRSRHREPSGYTLGWYITLVKRTLGGLVGYSIGKEILSWKMPPSHSDSSGPKMHAVQRYMSSVLMGDALQPSGSSSSREAKSDSSRIWLVFRSELVWRCKEGAGALLLEEEEEEEVLMLGVLLLGTTFDSLVSLEDIIEG
jgi:hypothetical protein